MIALLASSLSTLPLSLRLRAFGLLERLAPSAGARPTAVPLEPTTASPALWVYTSTIGELNAVEPFLDKLLWALGSPQLLLINDRDNYAPAFRNKYPDAMLATLDGSVRAAGDLARSHPPLLMMVAEIPAKLHDAPCRLAFATVEAARRSGAPVVLVNGWLYGYEPPSRMDALENKLFATDYLRAFDVMLVQTDEVRQALLAAGAPAKQVVVTGNIKFDAMDKAYALPSRQGSHDSLLGPLRARAAQGPVIVAGSVTETADQRSLLAAFEQLCAAHPDALLVLAPRHPENKPRMTALLSMLAELDIGYRLRSEHAAREAVQTRVLVLDTFGELRGAYSEATMAFVGNDHNVLEPLAFGKPVFVGPGWESTYPSYPVYQQLRDAEVIYAVQHLDELGVAWLNMLADEQAAAERRRRSESVLKEAVGASERNLTALAQSPRVAALLSTAATATAAG